MSKVAYMTPFRFAEDLPSTTMFDFASKVANMVSFIYFHFTPHFLIHPFAFRAWGCFPFVASYGLGYLHRRCVTRTSCPRRSTPCVFSCILWFRIHLWCFFDHGCFTRTSCVSSFGIHLGCFSGGALGIYLV